MIRLSPPTAGLMVAAGLGGLFLPRPHPGADTVLRVVSGVDAEGRATAQWLAMLRKRLSPEEYGAVAPVVKPLNDADTAWSALIHARREAWKDMVAVVQRPFPGVVPPEEVLIVLGNRGAEDAFTHDPTTIGFDLAALQRNYGDATAPANPARIDRFFRHEFTHLLQKAWLRDRPWTDDTPIGAALLDIWLEGLGNYYSLSARWHGTAAGRSEATAQALRRLEPRFVARIAALACASPAAATPLLADLSWGRFDQKWGALTAALWLEAEARSSPEALTRFVADGPAGVWQLAERHLPDALAATLIEARAADSLCVGPQAVGDDQ